VTHAAMPPNDVSTCSPATQPTASGGSASTLTSHATEVTSGTVNGHTWSLWSANGESGANGLEDGGLLIDGHEYGLCPGYPNPAELELADIDGQAIVYGVVGYPGLATVDLYRSIVGTFDRGAPLPSPSVQVVRGVSFFIGTLPGSACGYPALELNTTSPGVSAEHNLGFGGCTSGELVPIEASQGIWQLSPGQFPSGFGSGPGRGIARVPLSNSDCSPRTDATASGGPASTLTSHATEVTSGTVDGHTWSLWSANGQSGATGLENGGLLIDGHEYGLCPGYPNPAELELADIDGQAIVYGVVGYHGLAKIQLYTGKAGSFVPGTPLPSPSVQVVHGVSFFIGALPGSACSYPAFELNTTSPGVSAEHNIGFGSCTQGQLVPITWSQGIWQLPPGQFPTNFGGVLGGGASRPSVDSDCSPATDAAASGGPASSLPSGAVQVASGTTGGHTWSLWSAAGQSGATGLEDGGLLVDGHEYGLCPGYPNPAELELADIGSSGLVFGVIGYPGQATVNLYTGKANSFATGTPLPTPAVQVVRGVSFFIGVLPSSACDYPWLELNSSAQGEHSQHNLGFGACTAGQLVPITSSMGMWTAR
jgi:hypothetical protein